MVGYTQKLRDASVRGLKAAVVSEVIAHTQPNVSGVRINDADILSSLGLEPQPGRNAHQILMDYSLDILVLLLQEMGREVGIVTRPEGGSESQWRIVR